jgi:hypothetical protein
MPSSSGTRDRDREEGTRKDAAAEQRLVSACIQLNLTAWEDRSGVITVCLLSRSPGQDAVCSRGSEVQNMHKVAAIVLFRVQGENQASPHVQCVCVCSRGPATRTWKWLRKNLYCIFKWGKHILVRTKSVLNYSSFDFFYTKFNHSSYLKIYAKYHFFCCGVLY